MIFLLVIIGGLILVAASLLIWFTTEDASAVVLVFLTMVMMCFTFFGAGTLYGNKQGQIQILSGGAPTYELIENKDNTKTWEEIKNDI